MRKKDWNELSKNTKIRILKRKIPINGFDLISLVRDAINAGFYSDATDEEIIEFLIDEGWIWW
jgi:hypothetical protein